MPDYDFTGLSPIDFEILVRDLIQEERKIRLESFKAGKDSGIDFRYSRSRKHKLIIQCKHYAHSSFSSLYREMKSELEKVKTLNPNSYLLATSLPLSPNQKTKLEKLLSPFVQLSGDIYGREDLNNLLGKFREIERRTFKLWMASVPVFEEILHSGVKNFSRDALETIREHAKYYVQNESFTEALEILKKHNFCIVAGIPGIGKTILAEMLLLHFLDAKYEVVKIYSDISEAASLDYVNQRRIFYYDDFLGQTASLDKLGKNEDQRLLDFIATMRKSRVSKLILTTREYILNQVRFRYEKLSRSEFRVETCVVDLSKYTRLNRAKILFNHIYFSNLPASHKEALLNNRNYLKIIDHANYNPRIVELMTEFSRVAEIPSSRYFEFFVSNLENPMLIWRHAFDHQLSRAAKALLMILTSMPAEIFIEDCREAFDSFYRAQAGEYGFQISSEDFMNALKELDGNFIKTERAKHGTLVMFHNPSVKDFMSNYLTMSGGGLAAILKTAVFHNQVAWVWQFGREMLKHSTFSEFLSTHEPDLIEAMHGTLGSKSCDVVNFRNAGEFYKGRWTSSIESRVKAIADVVGELRSELALNLLADAIEIVRGRIKELEADHDDLVQLLTTMRDLKLLDSPQAQILVGESKLFFMLKPWWVRHLEAFCEFRTEFPALVAPEDEEQVRNILKEVAKEAAEQGMSDPDEIRDEAEIIESLGRKLDVDVAQYVSALESRADNLDVLVPPDDSLQSKPLERKGDSCSDGEIDSLFAMLSN